MVCSLSVHNVFFFGRKKHEHVSDSRSFRNMVLGIKKQSIVWDRSDGVSTWELLQIPWASSARVIWLTPHRMVGRRRLGASDWARERPVNVRQAWVLHASWPRKCGGRQQDRPAVPSMSDRHPRRACTVSSTKDRDSLSFLSTATPTPHAETRTPPHDTRFNVRVRHTTFWHLTVYSVSSTAGTWRLAYLPVPCVRGPRVRGVAA